MTYLNRVLYNYDDKGRTTRVEDEAYGEVTEYTYDDDGFSAYYLQSRYYEDKFNRFLNADIPDIAYQSKDETNGLNLFAYCNNNPVNYVDFDGHSAVLTFATIVAIVVTALSYLGFVYTAATIQNNVDFKPAIDAISNLNRINNCTKAAILAIFATSLLNTYKYAKTIVSSKTKTLSASLTIACANEKIKIKVRKNSKERYWLAYLNYLYNVPYITIGSSVKYSTAKSCIASRNHIFTVTKYEARTLANACGGIKEYHSNNQHNGYFPHYHPKISKNSHIWFRY